MHITNAYMAQAALCGAAVPLRPRRELAVNALSNYYKSKDGRWLMLTAANEGKEWFDTSNGGERVGR